MNKRNYRGKKGRRSSGGREEERNVPPVGDLRGIKNDWVHQESPGIEEEGILQRQGTIRIVPGRGAE